METMSFNTIGWQTDIRPHSVDDPTRKARKKRRLAMWSYIRHVRYELRTCSSLVGCLQATTLPDLLREECDEYPDWHPASYDFGPIVQALLYKELTNRNYEEVARDLQRWPEVSAAIGLNSVPDASTFSRTWRNRFPEQLRDIVTTWVNKIRAYAQKYDVSIQTVREESTENDASESTESNDDAFSSQQITQMLKLGRSYAFAPFDSERADNSSYDDSCFLELQSYIGMVGCGANQGSRRFAAHSHRDQTPHGDTHLRAVQQFDPDQILSAFDDATEQMLEAIDHLPLQEPVTVAIDTTTIPYYGTVEDMPMVSGTKHEYRGYKFATLTLVGRNVPLVLAVEPVMESSPWDDNRPNQMHRLVRRLVRRAKQLVTVDTVVCDREFDSMGVFQTLSNLNVNYLIPKRTMQTEATVIEKMDAAGEDVAVEAARVNVEHGSHEMRFCYVPTASEESDGTAVFAINVAVSPDDAEGFCRRYSDRWQIENEYKTIKHDFLATTSSKNYRVRSFYFVFAVLLYNLWRLTDLLLKGGVSTEIVDFSPYLTAGEFVDYVAKYLRPID